MQEYGGRGGGGGGKTTQALGLKRCMSTVVMGGNRGGGVKHCKCKG